MTERTPPDNDTATKNLLELIQMLEAGSYQSSYESRMIDKAKAVLDALNPETHTRITISFIVDIARMVRDYERILGNPTGISHKQMLTELLTNGYSASVLEGGRPDAHE